MSSGNLNTPSSPGMLSPTADASSRQSPSSKGTSFQMSQSVIYQQQKRQSYQINKELRIKFFVRDFLEGKFVTILMSLVTIFALVGVSTTPISDPVG